MKTDESMRSTTDDTLKRLAFWLVVVGLILMIPFVTNAPWTGSDYVFAGIVLSACAAGYVYATRNTSNNKRKVAIGAGILFFIFMVIGWAASGP